MRPQDLAALATDGDCRTPQAMELGTGLAARLEAEEAAFRASLGPRPEAFRAQARLILRKHMAALAEMVREQRVLAAFAEGSVAQGEFAALMGSAETLRFDCESLDCSLRSGSWPSLDAAPAAVRPEKRIKQWDAEELATRADQRATARGPYRGNAPEPGHQKWRPGQKVRKRP